METTEDERFEILYVYDRAAGKKGNAIFLRDRSRRGEPFAPLVGAITDDSFHVIGNVGGELLVHTDKDAPKGRIVRIDPGEPDEKNWKTVVAERPEPLERASTAGGKLFAVYMHDVTARVRVHGLDGAFEHDLALPGPGTVDGFIGERGAASAFFTFTSFTQPTTVYRYDIASRATAVFCASALPGFDASSFETRQVFVDKQGRHARADVPRPSQGAGCRRHEPGADVRLRRVQRLDDAEFQCAAARVARAGIHLRERQHAGRRRVRRSVARRGNEDEKAERVRRLHRRRRMVDRPELLHALAHGDDRRVERRLAGRRRDESAAGSLQRGGAAGRRHGHAAIPQVHDWLELDAGLRFQRRP